MRFKYVRFQFPDGGDFSSNWGSIIPAPEDAALYAEITDWFRANLPFRPGLCHFKTENLEILRTIIEPAMALLEKYDVAFDAVYTNTPGKLLAEYDNWAWTSRVLERSCGAIVFTRRKGQILFAVVQEMAGAYSMPKGHMEGNETEMETAQREVFEEIGIHPAFLDGFRMEYEYDLTEKPGGRKKVTVFLAEFQDQELVPREGEIRRIQLLPYEQTLECFEHETVRNIFTAAYEFITSHGV